MTSAKHWKKSVGLAECARPGCTVVIRDIEWIEAASQKAKETLGPPRHKVCCDCAMQEHMELLRFEAIRKVRTESWQHDKAWGRA